MGRSARSDYIYGIVSSHSFSTKPISFGMLFAYCVGAWDKGQ